MSTQISTYDVFLSYSLTEGQTADLVGRALTEAGLSVVSQLKAPATADEEEPLWQILAESDALVAIIDPQRTLPSAIGVEVGAAMAWHKPVYVVHTEIGNITLPSHLGSIQAYPISRIDDVVQSLKRQLKPLPEEQQFVLRSVYAKLGIPMDKLLGEPVFIEKLARDFNQQCGTNTSGERLAQELVRLQKTDSLPHF